MKSKLGPPGWTVKGQEYTDELLRFGVIESTDTLFEEFCRITGIKHIPENKRYFHSSMYKSRKKIKDKELLIEEEENWVEPDTSDPLEEVDCCQQPTNTTNWMELLDPNGEIVMDIQETIKHLALIVASLPINENEKALKALTALYRFQKEFYKQQ